MTQSRPRFPFVTLALLVIFGGLVTFLIAFQTVEVLPVQIDGKLLSLDEQAYYEYVAPRLDMLVTEVSATRVMVESKSRDLISLTRAGNIIETLTGEITAYGEEHGVPPRFADVHTRIVAVSDVVNKTFDQAHKSLKTFNFSGMRDLVGSFGKADDEFTAIQAEMQEIAGISDQGHRVKESMTMQTVYEVRYLLNGEGATMTVEESSAAAASEAVQHTVSGDNDAFELIQVQPIDNTESIADEITSTNS